MVHAHMDDDGHIDERPMIEDDRDVLFASVGCATDDDGPARVWRLLTTMDGHEGVSTAMTLESAREFATALREDGVTVIRIEGVHGEVVTGEGMFGEVSITSSRSSPIPADEEVGRTTRSTP